MWLGQVCLRSDTWSEEVGRRCGMGPPLQTEGTENAKGSGSAGHTGGRSCRSEWLEQDNHEESDSRWGKENGQSLKTQSGFLKIVRTWLFLEGNGSLRVFGDEGQHTCLRYQRLTLRVAWRIDSWWARMESGRLFGGHFPEQGGHGGSLAHNDSHTGRRGSGPGYILKVELTNT